MTATLAPDFQRAMPAPTPKLVTPAGTNFLPGQSPAVTITSPRPGANYLLNTAAPEQKLALSCEGRQGRVYWFVNRSFYAVQEEDDTLLWPMRPGNFTISLVDEHGKSASVTFRITDTAAGQPVP